MHYKRIHFHTIYVASSERGQWSIILKIGGGANKMIRSTCFSVNCTRLIFLNTPPPPHRFSEQSAVYFAPHLFFLTLHSSGKCSFRRILTSKSSKSGGYGWGMHIITLITLPQVIDALARKPNIYPYLFVIRWKCCPCNLVDDQRHTDDVILTVSDWQTQKGFRPGPEIGLYVIQTWRFLERDRDDKMQTYISLPTDIMKVFHVTVLIQQNAVRNYISQHSNYLFGVIFCSRWLHECSVSTPRLLINERCLNHF